MRTAPSLRPGTLSDAEDNNDETILNIISRDMSELKERKHRIKMRRPMRMKRTMRVTTPTKLPPLLIKPQEPCKW